MNSHLRQSPDPPAPGRQTAPMTMTFNATRYTLTNMILSFNCKETQSLYEGCNPKCFQAFAAQAQRKLEMLAAAHAVEDLRSPPGNRLEKLMGNRDGQWSIRINAQWRLCFEWSHQGAQQVEIVDYH